MEDFIRVYNNVLPQGLCDRLIKRFEASPYKAPGLIGSGVDTRRKKSTDITLNLYPEWHDILHEIGACVSPQIVSYLMEMRHLLTGPRTLSLNLSDGRRVLVTHDTWNEVADDVFEQSRRAGVLRDGATPDLVLAEAILQLSFGYSTVNIQCYREGDGNYKHWHSEQFPTADNDALHRVLFFICYLNNVPEGGETEFYYQKRLVTPKAGRLVIAPAAFTHTHRGNTPTSNDKYIATSWINFTRVPTPTPVKRSDQPCQVSSP